MGLRIVLVLLATWLLVDGQSEDSLMVEITDGRVLTRQGCRVQITCSAVAQRLEWRKFGQPPLENSENREVITRINQTSMKWQSDVIFDPITIADRGAYTCEIQAVTLTEDDVSAITRTVVLLVASDPVAIDPPIADVNISTRVIGETASIGCPVATCATEVSVSLMKGNASVGEGTLSGTMSQRVYNFLVPVDRNTPGTYTCKADIEGFSAMQDFDITGTPRDATSIPVPSQTVSATTPPVTGSITPSPQISPPPTTAEPDAALPTMAYLSLLSFLLLASALLLI